MLVFFQNLLSKTILSEKMKSVEAASGRFKFVHIILAGRVGSYWGPIFTYRTSWRFLPIWTLIFVLVKDLLRLSFQWHITSYTSFFIKFGYDYHKFISWALHYHSIVIEHPCASSLVFEDKQIVSFSIRFFKYTFSPLFQGYKQIK